MPEVERIGAFGQRVGLRAGWRNAGRGWRCGGHRFYFRRVRFGVEWHACESRSRAATDLPGIQFQCEVRDGERSVGRVLVSSGLGRDQNRNVAGESVEVNNWRSDSSRWQQPVIGEPEGARADDL